jgi:hypothetical protein
VATYNVPPGPNVTLANVLANGNDAGTQTITAGSGAHTIWDGTNMRVPNASVQGLVNLAASAFSGYPLKVGTDLPAAGVANYAATTDPAYKLSAYPLVPGVDVTGLGKVVAKAVAVELTTTTATTIVTFTPTANGVFYVKLILSVRTAATTVTASVSWTSAGTGAAETYTWENAASLPVGTRLELPLTIDATSATAIAGSVTAGTANQVYASASITELV